MEFEQLVQKEFVDLYKLKFVIFNEVELLLPEITRYVFQILIKEDYYWSKIRFHNRFFSDDDFKSKLKYHKENPNKKLNLKFNETHNFDLPFSKMLNIFYFKFPKSNLKKYAYKNLRIENNDDIIQKYGLMSNGYSIDQIYNESLSALRHIYGIKHNDILPFSFCKEDEYLIMNNSGYELSVRFKDKINDKLKLSVDIYEIIDDVDLEPNSTSLRSENFIYKAIYSQEQFTGSDYISSADKLRLDFNHIINYLIIHLSKGKLRNLKLQFNGIDFIINNDDIVLFEDKYIIPFTKSIDLQYWDQYGINFSRIDTAYIYLDIDGDIAKEEDFINVFAISYNEITITQNSLKVTEY